MLVTLAGMLTDFKFLHFAKAELPMLVTPLSMTMVSI